MTMTDDGVTRTERHRPAWADHTRVLAALCSGALIAFGLICWIAANWANLHRLTKLGLTAGVLLVAACAAFVPRCRVPALIVSTASVGGLLALIGQIYPSGADAWQLFCFWGLLALPFAVAGRHDALWSFWTIVVVTAIQLWNAQEGGFEGGSIPDWLPAWALSAVLALALCPLPPVTRLLGGTRWAFRIATLALTGLLLVTGIANIFEKHEAPVLVGLVTLGLGAAVLSRLRPLELGLLALWMLAFDILLIWRAAVLISPDGPGVGELMLLSVFATLVVGASVVLLRRWATMPPVEPITPAHPGSARSTWPLAVLSGVGAIVAAIPIIALFGLLFDSLVREHGALIGLVTLGAAILAMRRSSTVGFLQMFGAIAAAFGYALIAQGLLRTADKNIGFVLAAVFAVSAVLLPIAWSRAVLGFATATSFLLSMTLVLVPGHLTALAIAVGLTATLGAIALWVHVPERHGGAFPAFVQNAQSFVSGFTVAALIAAMLVAGRPFMIAASAILGELSSAMFSQINDASLLLSVMLAGAAAGMFFFFRPAYRTLPAYAVGAVALLFSTRSAMLGPALFVLACAALARTRAVAVFATITVLWIVSAAYYALNWTLTQKAWSMLALGLALAVVLLATLNPRRERAWTSLDREPSLLARGLIIAGVLLTSAITAISVSTAEQILRSGRPIFIALRPVDPRSLVQGDYMALAFDTAQLPQPSTARNREVIAIATLDARHVATLQRLIAPGEKPEGHEVALRLRTKSRRWLVGSDAWYFEEGEGKRFEQAKYGVFRVGVDGRLLLVGLADADLRPVP